MRAKRERGVLRCLLGAAGAVAALWMLFSALTNLQTGRADEGRRQLEASLRRAAVTCYASEGVYPPTVGYLEEQYGIQIDTDRYTVSYQAFAENLMPDITVLENGD